MTDIMGEAKNYKNLSNIVDTFDELLYSIGRSNHENKDFLGDVEAIKKLREKYNNALIDSELKLLDSNNKLIDLMNG